MAPCKSTAEEVSFEWSHHRISSKLRTTLHVSIIDSGSAVFNLEISQSLVICPTCHFKLSHFKNCLGQTIFFNKLYFAFNKAYKQDI